MKCLLCDRKVAHKLTGRIYKTVVRLALLYSVETWAISKKEEQKLDTNEMQMQRWMCGVTRKDKIRNPYIRGSVKIVEVSKKGAKKRFHWFGHLLRRERVWGELSDEDGTGRKREKRKV